MEKKKVKVIVYQEEINKLANNEFELFIPLEATVIDAIIEVDKTISAKDIFPIKKPEIEYQSLLHMTYNPLEKRMYHHILMQAFTESENWINVKYDPKIKLPDGTTVKIILKTICADETPEKVVDYETFQRAMLKEGYKIS